MSLKIEENYDLCVKCDDKDLTKMISKLKDKTKGGRKYTKPKLFMKCCDTEYYISTKNNPELSQFIEAETDKLKQEKIK